MKELPNFERYGYRVSEQLGQNTQSGRFTYKAIALKSRQAVVIKQFRFATSKDWVGYKAVERELEVLRGLSHRGIPKILDSFDSGDGLCLVQEYKDAPPLSASRRFTPAEIKSIAEAVLDILVYLQQQIPPVIHRDIKPENVLVDDQLNVYLIDFGLARMGGTAALSSVAAGTFGFMPPEQLLNRPLTTASDLYGVGATLICLLTGTTSTEIGNLIDHSFRFEIKYLPQLNRRFTQWLEKMVQPDLEKRFPNAKAALDALKPLDVVSLPSAKLSQHIQLQATKIGEVITHTVTVSNSTPETILEGSWEVPLNTSEGDQPYGHSSAYRAWLTVSPTKFAGNSQQCQIVVDTSKLMAAQDYEQQIFLKTTSAPPRAVTVRVRTAPLPIPTRKLPYITLGLWFALCWAGAVVVATASDPGIGTIVGAIAGIVLGAAIGSGIWMGGLGGAVFGAVGGTVVDAGAKAGAKFALGGVGGAVGGVMLVSLAAIAVIDILSTAGERQLSLALAGMLLFFSAVSGVGLGIGVSTGLANWWWLFLLGAIPLAGVLAYFPYCDRRLVAKYRQSEHQQNLIAPNI